MAAEISAKFASNLVPYNDFSLVSNNGESDGRCSLAGALGYVLNDLIINSWIKRGYNCTVTGFDAFGHFNGTGLKGAMGNKSIDASLIPTTIWESNIDHIDYTHPLYDDFLQLICAYNYTERFTDSDLIDAYLDFHWSYYGSLALTFAVFMLSWDICSKLASLICSTLRDKIRNTRLPSYWLMICAMLDQDQFPNIARVSFSILSLCFSFFFFVTIDSFMLNCMSSDLVTIEEPRVTRTYQDLVDRKDMRVMFFTGWDEEGFFRDAEKGTMESKIWEKRWMMDKLSVETIAAVWQPVIDQKVVLLVREWLGLSAANLGVTKMRQMGIDYIRSFKVRDETGKFSTIAFMIRKDAHKILKDFYEDRTYRISQSGILEWFYLERIPRLFGESELNLDKLVSYQLFLPEAPEPMIRLKNTYNIFYIYVTCIAISLLVLLYEFVHSNNKKVSTEEKLNGISVVRYKLVKRRMRKNYGIIGFLNKLWRKIFDPIVVV